MRCGFEGNVRWLGFLREPKSHARVVQHGSLWYRERTSRYSPQLLKTTTARAAHQK